MFVYENLKLVKVPELESVLNKPAGAGWSLLWHLFFYTRMLKYVHIKQFKQINTSFNKIATRKKLRILCELGYFREVREQVYIATNKVIPILKQAGLPTSILPNQSTGKGEINEMNNTETLIQATNLKHFYALLYYDFVYLRPDALLVLNNEKEKKYKLVFIEIEARKPNWNSYLQNKRDNYIRLAKDKIFYDYWKIASEKLSLRCPPLRFLKFEVFFISSIELNFGKGFKFLKNLI